MVIKETLKEAFSPREFMKYGFVRNPAGDFSDDGNRFREYIYKNDKGEMPMTYLKSDGQVYASIALHHKDELSYNDYKNLPSYKDADKYNGVGEDSVDVKDLADIASRLIDEYNEMVNSIEDVPDEELDARYSELVSAAKQNYNHMLTALREIDITKILTLGDYKLKQLKEYFNSAKNNIVNLVASKDRIKSGSIRARRDFMRYSESNIREYVENKYFYTKWIMDEIVSTLK